MTEERRAFVYASYFCLPDRLAADATADELGEIQESLQGLFKELIRTVAAEERKKGSKTDSIAQRLVNEWNEFEKPMPLEWDMPDPMRTIYEWACEWYAKAQTARTARTGGIEEMRDGVIDVLSDHLGGLYYCQKIM
jgi:hypothetical protein